MCFYFCFLFFLNLNANLSFFLSHIINFAGGSFNYTNVVVSVVVIACNKKTKPCVSITSCVRESRRTQSQIARHRRRH